MKKHRLNYKEYSNSTLYWVYLLQKSIKHVKWIFYLFIYIKNFDASDSGGQSKSISSTSNSIISTSSGHNPIRSATQGTVRPKSP